MPIAPSRGAVLGCLAALLGCGGGRSRGPDYPTPLNPRQAPLVTVRQILQADSLVGRRVRVVGTCALAGVGPSTGAWVLQDAGFSIEVRGLVPPSCTRAEERGQTLAIFAQVEPKDGKERLLLRLPE